MKLLLIEDEDFIRDLYKRQLELAGMPTDAFGLGNDGLNAAHQTPTAYDLVLLDIMLPDTNGLQILKDLKQNNATKQIPVILLTNLSQDMLIKEGFELGAEGYLVKAAYTPAQIVQEVKNILAKKPSAAVTQLQPQAPQAQPTVEPTQITQQPATQSVTPTPPTQAPIIPANPASSPVPTPSFNTASPQIEAMPPQPMQQISATPSAPNQPTITPYPVSTTPSPLQTTIQQTAASPVQSTAIPAPETTQSPNPLTPLDPTQPQS